MLRIGNIQLDVPFFQAPLSGYSDYPMRKLAYEFGCPLAFAGVMLAKSAVHPKILRKKIFRPQPDEKLVGAQILGRDPDMMAKGASALVNTGYKVIDINFACPARKVLARGRGGAILKEPELGIKIFRKVKESVDVPVIVKIRKAFQDDSNSEQNVLELADGLVNEGVDALVVHGRTVEANYKGKADWKFISEIKTRFNETTVIGSGDLFESEEIKEKIIYSGIDGALIARGAIGNPWIFRELKAVFNGGKIPESPSLKDQAKVIKRHLEMALSLFDERRSVRYLRKFLIQYCRLHPRRKKAQMEFMSAKSKNELKHILKKWYLN